MLLSEGKSAAVFAFATCLEICCAYDFAHDGNETTEKPENVTRKSEEESEFPEDLFTEEQRRHGAIILHAIFAMYCFAAIATVCTEYFLPTIRCICQALNISDDVAAATFMSAATASPELFTNIIGTFITKSDIGVGHVLGNAYYNMFFVAALGGLAAKKHVLLDWWPITRDCVIYVVVSSTLTVIIWDGTVTIGETLVLLFLTVSYFAIMINNRRIIRFCRETLKIDISDPVEKDVEDLSVKKRSENESLEETEEKSDVLNPLTPPVYVVKPPEEKMWWNVAAKFLIQPLYLLTSYTIPDVRKDSIRKNYPITFVMCVVWIGMSTYFGTWMVSTIGATIGVPDSVMGMVFMAAGGSVVEAYAVFYKVRKGECSIGLSNSMGCNTLDVTLCMALPWFVRCIIPSEESSLTHVLVKSPGIQFNCVLLIASVITLFTILSLMRFKLSKILGAICGVVYISVLSIAISVET